MRPIAGKALWRSSILRSLLCALALAAYAWPAGLVDQVVPDGDVYDAAIRLAGQFRGGAAQALRAAKQAIDAGLGLDLDAGLEVERLHFSALFGTEDQKLGMHSFVEKGPGKARFVGR